jgi:hypothetical protein
LRTVFPTVVKMKAKMFGDLLVAVLPRCIGRHNSFVSIPGGHDKPS